ncbi:glycoside hydrolase family 28 protein [Niabella hirudinis]|uniref:glycoside hydrolase family 28 protein n=1 Tax=Niabella hirudinis TaxID=1285929 RepID=UPI003EBA2815
MTISRSFALLLLLIPVLLFAQTADNKTPHAPGMGRGLLLKSINVTAPFKMPALTVPDFSNCVQIRITDLGAMPGDKEKNALAISTAIDRANKAGGGTVIIPAGEWLTKKIQLKSNVNLHLEKGAVLLFSGDPADYLPAVHSSWEGMECYNYAPLIYAWQCRNIAITGEGTLRATMNIWQQWFSRPPAHLESIKRLYNLTWEGRPVNERRMVNDTAHLRPQFIQFNRSENVLLEGVSIINSPFWTIHPYRCSNVVIRNIRVYAHGHNNDGIDPEMTQNMLIENCVFDQGDDAIAIKSGRNPEGWRSKMPSKNIVIRHCTVKNGHQLVAIGSELSGGIENIFVDSCTVLDGAKLNHLLFIKTNERMGGYVKNIYMRHVKAGHIDLGILGIETDVLYQWRSLVPTYEKRLTPISNVFLSDVSATEVKFISRILAQPSLPVKNISLTRVTAGNVPKQNNIHEYVSGFRMQ